MGSSQNGKNLLPGGANSFHLEKTSFQKGIDVKGNLTDVKKVVSFVKMAEIYQVYLIPLSDCRVQIS